MDYSREKVLFYRGYILIYPLFIIFKKNLPPKKNLKLSKNAASPLAGEPQITRAFPRRLRRRKMFELISVYGAIKSEPSRLQKTSAYLVYWLRTVNCVRTIIEQHNDYELPSEKSNHGGYRYPVKNLTEAVGRVNEHAQST